MIRLAKNVELPLEFVTERIAFLARTGSGKSGGMRVLFEQIVDAQQFAVFIDPKGDAYGIRGEGTKAGRPVLIMGGDHADIPLESTAGAVVAEFLVRERISTVLDISDFSTSQMWKFVGDLTKTLYKLNRDPLMLFIDEVDMVAGQQYFDPVCLHGIQLIQNKGRSRGFGVTVASQRPQVVNKTVLNASGTLIAMQTMGDDALKVVKSCLSQTGTKETVNAILSELPTLQPREAFIYSPQTLGPDPVRMTFDSFTTFDSMRTPRPGEARTAPKSLADIDLGAVQRDMAETIEKVNAEDPKTLRAEIARLRGEVMGLRREAEAVANKPAPAVEPETVCVPVLDTDKLDELHGVFNEFRRNLNDKIEVLKDRFREALDEFTSLDDPVGLNGYPIDVLLGALRKGVPELPTNKFMPERDISAYSKPENRTVVAIHRSTASKTIDEAVRDMAAASPEGKRSTHDEITEALNELYRGNLKDLEHSFRVSPRALSTRYNKLRDFHSTEPRDQYHAKQLKIIDTLATFETLGKPSVDRSIVAAFAEVSAKSSTLRAYLAKLKADGMIEYLGGSLALTDQGRMVADRFKISSLKDVHDAWLKQVKNETTRRMLELILANHPAAVRRQFLADQTGVSITSSTMRAHMATLNGFGVIRYVQVLNTTTNEMEAGVEATDLLFPEGLY